MIIFISGPLGSGKSTLAQKLKTQLPRSAILEPDAIRAFIADIPINKAVPIVLEITALAIKSLVRNGFNIIVPYPLSEKNYEFLRKRIKGERLYFFVLNPRREVIQRGRGKRKLTLWEKERMLHHYKINLHDPTFGVKIDNTRQNPIETARVILRNIKNSK